MTKATARPVRRKVVARDDEFVAELRDRTLTLRPIRTRSGGPAEITVTWGQIYLRAMMQRADTRKSKKRGGR